MRLPGWRRLALLTPLLSTVLVRLGQLLTLLTFSWVPHSHGASFAVTALGGLSGLLIMSDAGGASYVLSRGADGLTRRQLARVVRAQTALTGGCAVVGLIVVAWFGRDVDGLVLAALVAVAVGQVLESVLRVVRAPLLLRRDDLRYGSWDAVLGLSKVALVACCWLAQSLAPLLLIPLISGGVLAVAYTQVGRSLSEERGRVPAFLEIWEYGLSGSLSALYSQSPLLVAGFVMPLSDAAQVVLAYRFVQAAEVVPATFSNQAIPRIAQRGWTTGRVWGASIALGLGCAAILAVLEPVLGRLSGAGWNPAAFLVLCAALVLKCGNYGLVAVLLAHRRARSKAVVTVIVGLCSGAAAVLVGQIHGAVGLSWLTAVSEALLAVGLASVARPRPQPEPIPEPLKEADR